MEFSDVDEVQIFFVRAVLNSLFIVKSILTIDRFFLLMIHNKDSYVPNFVRFWGFALNPLFEVTQFPNYNKTVVVLCFKICFEIKFVTIGFEKSITRSSFLCCQTDIKIP